MKEVVLTGDVGGYCERVLSLVPRVLGPRLGGAVQQVIKAVKAGDWSVADGVVTAGGVRAGGWRVRAEARGRRSGAVRVAAGWRGRGRARHAR